MSGLKLSVLAERFTIHRLDSFVPIPAQIALSPFYSIVKTADEVSIVCVEDIHFSSDKYESGWRAIKVLGPLDFTLTGILARISTILAEEKISIFAVSTYDTDYVLVKEERLHQAMEALVESGYHF